MFPECRALPIAKGGDAMKKFDSFLSPLIQAYVEYQKASEHWNEASYEPNLLLFDRLLSETVSYRHRIIPGNSR